MGMYNFKNVMLGFGLGLVLSSLVNINTQSKDMTVDFIKSEAMKKGLILIDPKDIINKDINMEDEGEEEVISIEIRIKEGFDSYKTSEILYDKGLIEDKQSFIDLLYKYKKIDSIQCGVFIIQNDASMEEIINIITNSSNNIE